MNELNSRQLQLSYEEMIVLRNFLGVLCRDDVELMLDSQQIPNRKNRFLDERSEKEKLADHFFRRSITTETEVCAVNSILTKIYSRLSELTK